MSVDFQRMSPQEVQFVKLYALALKKNYDEFFNALQMMRSEIGIKCPVAASRLGRQLQEMDADFEHELALLATRHRARVRDLPKMPTTAELIKLLQVSFFKLVNPADDPPADKGWFSGHPFEWEKAYKTIQQVQKASALPSPPLSALLKAFLNLFGDNDLQVNITYIPGFPHKNLPPPDMHQDHDDEYYNDDEDDENEDDGPDYGISY